MTTLKVQLSIQVPSGPTVQSTRTVEVDKYETFDLSIPPNSAGTAAAGIDRMPKPEEGPIKLLLIQSNIYPKGEGTGEIKLTVEATPILDKPLHEPLFLLGPEVIASLRESNNDDNNGEISKISFVNTYQPTEPDNKKQAEDKVIEVNNTLVEAKNVKKQKEEAVQALKDSQDVGAKATAEEELKAANAEVTTAEEELKAANAEVTKAIAAVEKEIADHTAQLSIFIGRDAPAD
ncbi:MAG: hypothetical protein AAGD25_07085 [Cyanobacteria bacterium P01_F01_bin.150]